ncbi:5-methyltetrahydropteroyltriglutamate--homocysteine S-methyltransferase [Salsuginibacillus kocurii]|uniref:5-methyltetrahydropteroyltriglutamate-- homocysteine S-methyltransferase n=1 Tax=Salsuginibacillus kocurii TaxID=427078 RepID=UPI0003753443|nr:5-methyltetrahydropteroyltriglutamate--homocysteine S-methyltransferase [Salsuginibacillus kocurii]
MSRSVIATNIGYPQLDGKREWKRVLESYWKEDLSATELYDKLEELKVDRLKKQEKAGIHYVPVNDFTYYDRMLDVAWMFNLIPARHQHTSESSLRNYFSMARGEQTAEACAMKKWFNTNYHYIVPEWEGQELSLIKNMPLAAWKEAKEAGISNPKPTLVGPFTFAYFSKGFTSVSEALETVLPLYKQMIEELDTAGVEWLQIEEPALVVGEAAPFLKEVHEAYSALRTAAPRMKLFIQTYYEALVDFDTCMAFPVDGWGLDLTSQRALAQLTSGKFPDDKVLGAGIITGDNIWRAHTKEKASYLQAVLEKINVNEVWVQPTTSLLHVPETKTHETRLPAELYDRLSFADEKLTEVVEVTEALKEGQAADQDTLATYLAQDPVPSVFKDIQTHRGTSFEKRQEKQQAFNLPLLPTTTIGSLPQTTEVRKLRRDWKRGDLSTERYEEEVRGHIKKWVQEQEELGLDVLVHGEFERNDMVEFFGEKLDGFAFTDFGWVQSYGSRGVKPPIIHSDVKRPQAMTVEETVYAQSLTEQPLKGMLTGPVTIVNWSFVRSDQPKADTAAQVAEALAEEVLDLEKAGISMIQIDEPAFKEGYPLKKEDRPAYEDWAVKTFQRTHRDVKDETQIHTHMCYSEFQDILPAIGAMDADVISIEASKSGGDILAGFEDGQHVNEVGLGVYDIHSPRIPDVDEMESMLNRCLTYLPVEVFWVNPDCGLKTRSEKEVRESLAAMVQAAKRVRASVQVKQS